MNIRNPPFEKNQSPASTRIAFVTGTLAEPALRQVLGELPPHIEPVVIVLHIQVAALMTADWVARKLPWPPEGPAVQRLILPGYCRGDLEPLRQKTGLAQVELGPVNLHDLPEYLTGKVRGGRDLTQHSIEIIAEINHAPRLTLDAILAQADALVADGADILDIGCDPQSDRPAWTGLADVVKELAARLDPRGVRISIDTFHPDEVALAAHAGASLVLSVNSTNCHRAHDWGIEVVAIPDTPADLDSLARTVEQLEKDNVRYRLDPIIEPIGFGFANSLGRYLETRRRFPQSQLMMGIGNLSEMTEVDSAGVNMLLIGFCQELNITSVLTTQVINYCRSAVREIAAARRIMHYAIKNRVPPKHLDNQLVMLRDPKVRDLPAAELDRLAQALTDDNIRLFAQGGEIHALRKGAHVHGPDPFVVFDELQIPSPSHAFYLGYEMAKAMTALALGKNYTQDEPLRWGLLTRSEVTHYERRKRNKDTSV